ncbi:MAG: CBS domain-containing protein [Clostridiales Family XIII bacterium]|jgi:CBS domain-containing protein|nr:CBS domain-containing protein [Clostridiales Family XIII bacterium]
MTMVTEIMEKVPYTCPAGATVGDVIRQLANVQVTGVPIVDGDMRLVGYITDGDIMRFIAPRKPQVYSWCEHMPILVDDDPVEEKMQVLLDKPVLEIASRKKIYAEVDWDISEVADLFRREKVKKIAVLDGGRVVGVVTESAIIRHILQKILPGAGPEEPDGAA